MSRSRTVQYFAGACVSLAFAFTGASFSWSSPAIPKFKSGEVDISISDVQSSWVIALLPLGALPGCYVGQILSEGAGRRKTIYYSSVPGITGSLIILLTTVPWLMYIARLLIGVAMGITAVVTMVYITEIADKEVRGALGMLVQVMNNLGSLLVYGVGPFVSYTTLNSMVLAIPVCYVLLCTWIPESPYYYLKDGRVDEARRAFMFVKGIKDQKKADEELEVIKNHVKESMENKSTMRELFTNIIYRKALYIVAGLKILQYMTGCLAIQSYLEMIFIQSSSISGPSASIVYGFVQLGAGIGATFFAGWFGRRILMLNSCLGVAMSLTLVGAYFFIKDWIQASLQVVSSISSMPLIGILGFNIFYAIGIGNLPYVMQAELFPVNVKVVASSAATMAACIMNFVVTKCYQSIKDLFGLYTVFWSFAVIGYLGVFFIHQYVPETKDKTLEEVNTNVQIKEEEPLRPREELQEKSYRTEIEVRQVDS